MVLSMKRRRWIRSTDFRGVREGEREILRKTASSVIHAKKDA